MNNYLLYAIITVVVVLLYFVFRKQTVSTTTGVSVKTIQAAPGVSADTGTVPNPAPPPNRGSNTSAIGLATGITTGVLQHIPVVGTPASAVVRAGVGTALAPIRTAATITNGLTKMTTGAIDHIPVVGKIATAPIKAASKIVNSVSHGFGLW
jgi:hypothetical protein